MKCTKTVLVTGAAGFIGFHLCEHLVRLGHDVVGIDNINDYYDVDLKYARLNELGIKRNKAEVFGNISQSTIYKSQMKFIRLNIEDRIAFSKIFENFRFNVVCNLAAQPGVRYSIENPFAYIDSNINGFLNVLECCRQHKITRLVYASSSSVYGNCTDTPFKETANVDEPISLYAATKKSNELMAYTYSHLYNIETIGLRFFTVYGPWGRPDMATFLFTNAILNREPIKVFNKGEVSRDFTFIDDIVIGVAKTILESSKNISNYKIYNIGNNTPIKLLDFINTLENKLCLNAKKKMLPMQAGDVYQTWANISKLQKDYNYSPSTSLNNGINAFVSWYKAYFKINDSST